MPRFKAYTDTEWEHFFLISATVLSLCPILFTAAVKHPQAACLALFVNSLFSATNDTYSLYIDLRPIDHRCLSCKWDSQKLLQLRFLCSISFNESTISTSSGIILRLVQYKSKINLYPFFTVKLCSPL